MRAPTSAKSFTTIWPLNFNTAIPYKLPCLTHHSIAASKPLLLVTASAFSLLIYNGNYMTDWSLMKSVIICQVINKIRRPCHDVSSWVRLHTKLDDTKSGYQLIISKTKFKKEVRQNFQEKNGFHPEMCSREHLKVQASSYSMYTMVHTVQLLRHDAYCPITLFC